jgi:hypothetical protein
VLRMNSPATARIRTSDGNMTALYQASNQVHSQKLPITFVMSVRLSRPPPRISPFPAGRISIKFDTGEFYENQSRAPPPPNSIKIEQKYRTSYMKLRTFCFSLAT